MDQVGEELVQPGRVAAHGALRFGDHIELDAALFCEYREEVDDVFQQRIDLDAHGVVGVEPALGHGRVAAWR